MNPDRLDTTPTLRLSRRVERFRPRIWLFVLLLSACGAYTFLVSAGFVSHWPVYGTFHDLLADGFRRGQLNLPISAAPELLNSKNPYDPVNMRYWVLDASFYQGKYYVYWGPVPALFQAVAKNALGIQRIIGDQYLALFFLCIALWSGALIVERMARRLFGSISKLSLGLAILAFAFAAPTVHAATTASTYHTAIIAAQAWLLAGLLLAFDAVWFATIGKVQRLRLVLAGLAWGLALASRVSVLPTLAVLILSTACGVVPPGRGRSRAILEGAFWLGLPVALVGCGLLTYNKLRFDSWLEFGTNLHLSAFPLHFSSKYLMANTYSYVLRPFETSCEFPYFIQVWRMGAVAFPEGMLLPRTYLILEPVVGWLRSVPITWLIPFAFLLAPGLRAPQSRRDRSYWWCLVSFTALATVTGLVALGIYTATMRYLSDVISGLVFLSFLAAFGLNSHRITKRTPKTIAALTGTLALGTLVMGILIGYHGYNGHFARFNPQLHGKLERAFSVCGDGQPKPLRYAP